MFTKYEDIAKAFTNEVMAIVDGDFQEALNFIRDMQSCVFLLIEKDKEKKALENPLVKAIQRKTYNEVLDMFGIIYDHTVDDLDTFAEVLWGYDEDYITTRNENYRIYCERLDFVDIIKGHLRENGYIDLVMLPNNELMEIPSEYEYKLEVNK